MSMKTALLTGLVAATALTACGPKYEDSGEVFSALSASLLDRGGEEASAEEAAVAQQAQVNAAAQAIASGETLLYASIPSREANAYVQEVGRNGSEVTWLSPDGITVTYENGLLVATRGLGPDLMAANVSGTVAAIRQGGGSVTRSHEYLDGLDHLVRQDYSCTVTRVGNEPIEIFEVAHATVKYEESCQSAGATFTNTYWVDNSGVVWKSRQLISPPVGYLDTYRL
ncbi:YjbF family lipoprotein [Pelagovum pacificum]|uniref:YjbF family lipoprotein n=1 Tax=Pelagovum pacificum TaxID=2588711 RepID=A0A5C5GGB8_9RHOB|nr:YjbF family lipoprotein [Pelagovum pacificum]QQA43074.1 YjbF family lipoprotein [Pelagovum pacificum]TNY33782.1 YjbF family lipoprotein [Pelagovum pacificum]